MSRKASDIVSIVLLLIVGSCIIGGIAFAIISAVTAPPEEPAYRTIRVESKTKEWSGQYCVGGPTFRTCGNTYNYFINAEKVNYHLWSQVEEGRNYKCDQHDNCEETEGEE